MTIFGLVIAKKSKVVSRAEYDDVILQLCEIDDEITAIYDELEPIKAFMREHSDLVLEAGREFADAQKLFSSGMSEIVNFTPKVALEHTKKHGEA